MSVKRQSPTIWVMGNGQLGSMLKHAGAPLSLNVQPVDVMEAQDQVVDVKEQDFITAEREQWPKSSLSMQLSQHPNFINASIFPLLANRLTQKQLLDDLKIPTAPWQEVTSNTTEQDLFEAFGDKVLLKRCIGGYDGQGQHWLKQIEQSKIPDSWRELAIAEQAINFDEEVSLIGVRTRNGHCQFYPLTLNYHQDGILYASVAPLTRLGHLQAEAEIILSAIMSKLDYIGVMAMECFRIDDDLLVNELAPRVHNSGHWTQIGCHINQFELHLRALCDLPITQLSATKQTLMLNLLGVEYNPKWLSLPRTQLFWYDKTCRPRRKMGHLNIDISDPDATEDFLAQLSPLLPIEYQDTLDWLTFMLANQRLS